MRYLECARYSFLKMEQGLTSTPGKTKRQLYNVFRLHWYFRFYHPSQDFWSFKESGRDQKPDRICTCDTDTGNVLCCGHITCSSVVLKGTDHAWNTQIKRKTKDHRKDIISGCGSAVHCCGICSDPRRVVHVCVLTGLKAWRKYLSSAAEYQVWVVPSGVRGMAYMWCSYLHILRSGPSL